MLTLFPQKPRRECGLLCILTHYALVSGTHSTGIWACFGSLDTQSNIRYGRSITADVVASLFVGCWTLETPWRHFGSRINISMSLGVRVVNGQLHEIHGKERLDSLIPHLSRVRWRLRIFVMLLVLSCHTGRGSLVLRGNRGGGDLIWPRDHHQLWLWNGSLRWFLDVMCLSDMWRAP